MKAGVPYEYYQGDRERGGLSLKENTVTNKIVKDLPLLV